MRCTKIFRSVLSLIFLVLLGLLPSYASADEIVDDIKVHTEANGDVVAVIKFAFQIGYTRHFPQRKSSFTSIYFNILGSVPADVWQDYESHRTPPSDVIEDITVSTRDRGTGPKVQLKFYRPAEFTVSMGSNSQILLVRIKPVTPQQKSEDKTVPAQAAGMALPLVTQPATTSPQPSAKKPSVSTSTAPVALAPVAPTPVATDTSSTDTSSTDTSSTGTSSCDIRGAVW